MVNPALPAHGYDPLLNELTGVTRKPRCKRVNVIIEVHRTCCRSAQGEYQWRLAAAIRFCSDGFQTAGTRGKWLELSVNFILDHPTFGPLARSIQHTARSARLGDMFISVNNMECQLFCEFHQMTLETISVVSDVKPERLSFDAKCVRLTVSTTDLMGLEKMSSLVPRSQISLAMGAAAQPRQQYVDKGTKKGPDSESSASDTESDSSSDASKKKKKKNKKVKRERSVSPHRPGVTPTQHAPRTVAPTPPPAPPVLKFPTASCTNCQGAGHTALKSDKKCDQKGDCPTFLAHLKRQCPICRGKGHYTNTCVSIQK